MKFNETKMKQIKDEVLKNLEESEDKSQAIVDAIDKIMSVQYEDLIKEIKEEATQVEYNKEYSKKVKLRTLSKEEETFLRALVNDPKQAITANQVDVIPTTMIDITLENIKEENPNGVLSDVEFAPADVKKWMAADKTGTFAWGALLASIEGELEASFSGVDIEVNKLSAYLIIPKALRDLALPFVDKYFMAILKENITDGLEYGYLQGTGKNQPIGIYKQIKSVNEDGTHKDKTVNTTLTNFTPKGLASAKKYLNNEGKRLLSQLSLYCHPNDEADYVAPALYNSEGKLVSSYKNLTVKQSTQNPQGKAALVIPKKYVLGLKDMGIKEYDQTKALDDADVVIAKCYANGRAVDDNVPFIFDVTKLEEYVEKVKVVGTVEANTTTTAVTENVDEV